MFEIGVIAIIVLAVGYWVTLWLMGRHDDVLHGDFVHDDDSPDAASALSPSAEAFPRPPFPKKPKINRPGESGSTQVGAVKPVLSRAPSPSLPQAALPLEPDHADTLETLLASLKRDLKDASQL